MEQNGRQIKQDIDIAEAKNDREWIKREINSIKVQVFNHLPTELSKCVKRTDFIIGVVGVIIVQLILKFFI